jgi:hypothetical protein
MTPSGTRGMTPYRSTSRMRYSRAPSSRGGASGPRSRRQEACSKVREDELAPRVGAAPRQSRRQSSTRKYHQDLALGILNCGGRGGGTVLFGAPIADFHAAGLPEIFGYAVGFAGVRSMR